MFQDEGHNAGEDKDEGHNEGEDKDEKGDGDIAPMTRHLSCLPVLVNGAPWCVVVHLWVQG